MTIGPRKNLDGPRKRCLFGACRTLLWLVSREFKMAEAHLCAPPCRLSPVGLDDVDFGLFLLYISSDFSSAPPLFSLSLLSSLSFPSPSSAPLPSPLSSASHLADPPSDLPTHPPFHFASLHPRVVFCRLISCIFIFLLPPRLPSHNVFLQSYLPHMEGNEHSRVMGLC